MVTTLMGVHTGATAADHTLQIIQFCSEMSFGIEWNLPLITLQDMKTVCNVSILNVGSS